MSKKDERSVNRPRKLNDRIRNYPNDFKTDTGLYLRIAELIVVAPIDYNVHKDQRRDHCQVLHYLFLGAPTKLHKAAIDASTVIAEQHPRVLTEAVSERPTILQDTGFFDIVQPGKKYPEYRINLFGHGNEFTKPEDDARQETARLFQAQLGAGFCIKAANL